MDKKRRRIVAVLTMDLSEASAKSLTEDVLRRLWADKLDDQAFLSGVDEKLLSASLREMSPDGQLKGVGVCGECVIAACKDVECRELLTLETWQGHPNAEWFKYCPRCGQKLPFLTEEVANGTPA